MVERHAFLDLENLGKSKNKNLRSYTKSQGGRVYRNIEEDNDKKQVEVLNSCENISNYLIIN